MENASRALLMAGGVLISIVIASALVMMWNTISGHQASGTDNDKEKQLAEFNSVFASYANETVMGTDIISLFNRVNSYDKNIENDILLENIQYEHIEIHVSIAGSQHEDEFKDVLKLNDSIKNKDIVNDTTNPNDTYSILKDFIDLETKVGKDNMTKLSTYVGGSNEPQPFNTLTYEKKADGTDDKNKPIKNIVWQVWQEKPSYYEANKDDWREAVIRKLLGKTPSKIPEDKDIINYSTYTAFKTTKFICTDMQYSHGQVKALTFEAKS